MSLKTLLPPNYTVVGQFEFRVFPNATSSRRSRFSGGGGISLPAKSVTMEIPQPAEKRRLSG